MIFPNLVECPPRSDDAEKSDNQPEGLPDDGDGWKDARCEKKDGGNKRAKGFKSRNELCRSEKFADPREGPIVPVESEPGNEKSVSENGEQSKKSWDGIFREL
jgi:hypothetical protein